MHRLRHIFWLGTKELRAVLTEPLMVGLIVFMFSGMVYMEASSVTDSVNNASIAIVDEDNSVVSRRIANAFYPPNFQRPDYLEAADVTEAMGDGKYLFVLSFPPDFERDLRRGWHPTVYLDIDATAMMQAGLGDGYIQNIVAAEIAGFLADGDAVTAVALETRRAFNPNGTFRWFQAVSSVLEFLSLVTIILVGAALIREREHGTIEHLLVMPLTATEVALAKIWANGLIILVAFSGSLTLVVEGWLDVPVAGARGLLMLGAAAFLFAQASIGILLGILARSMAQFALLMLLVVLPMMMLSGGMSPIENQPNGVRQLTWLFPSRHFLSFAHAVVFRGADLPLVWPDLVRLMGQGVVYLLVSLALFRRSLSADS